jgi:TadE-like protein
MLRFMAKSADKGSMVSEVRETASPEVDRRERESGQALVEFALILPVFVVLVVGIIQFGVGLNYWLDMQRIANQGARWGVVNKFPGMTGSCLTDPTVLCSGPNLQEYLAGEPISGGLKPCVNISFPSTTSEVGDPVKVELAIPFTFVPILKLGTIKLTADATMRLEQAPGRYAAGKGGTTC